MSVTPPPLRLLVGALVIGISMIVCKAVSVISAIIYERLLPRRVARALSMAIQSPIAGGKPRLIAIPYSHYCEKIRWTLDMCSNDDRHFREISIAPLLHAFPTMWYSGGRSTSTPQLITYSGDIYIDSTDILVYLHQQGNSWIFPNSEARRIEAYLSLELGPHSRRAAYYSGLVNDRAPLKPIFERNVDKVQSWIMSSVYPLTKFLMMKSMGIDKEGARRSRAAVDAVWERINALLSDGRRYLAQTDKPSAADITFAALSYPTIWPDQMSDLTIPLSEAWLAFGDEQALWVQEKRKALAGQFALRMYNEHRGTARVNVRRT